VAGGQNNATDPPPDIGRAYRASLLFIWSSSKNGHIAPAYNIEHNYVLTEKRRITKQMTTKILSISAFAAVLCFASFSAQAAEGCGRGAHRGPDGRCYLNGRVVVVDPAPVVVAPAPVVVVAPAGVVCGPGLRWHPGRHRCWAY
jgi:hypothetical protein